MESETVFSMIQLGQHSPDLLLGAAVELEDLLRQTQREFDPVAVARRRLTKFRESRINPSGPK